MDLNSISVIIYLVLLFLVLIMICLFYRNDKLDRELKKEQLKYYKYFNALDDDEKELKD